ncbi:geranylgeranyl pyrophosphate synthase [Agromyces luteolus]|uniref:Polyprenyl synthetase family protein n=1 Tax=Agromyces luteolus TaxID=88373 RepID=A0A7C9HQ89_9MICO|nr:polyprenyl synthetase family protein [Agromyces luteolus]MUN06709.1 polyprenyl synthetase family protein [Agromyces luteolus]GLK27776.1 geranylgeranyl pyrophosphate synthase [Agromyces luteolus]
MALAPRLVDAVNERLEEFLADRATILRSISDDLDPLAAFSKRFLSGGKRFRARFCSLGFDAVRGSRREQSAGATAERYAVVSASAALEVFHAAALVHDDLIDNSDTRRGAPAAHRVYEAQHRDGRWAGHAEEYGRATAILLGDLLLGWSDELLDEGLAALRDPAASRETRLEFNRMRTEVTVGQYLDILEERAWLAHPEAEQRSRAERVVVHKSARYSIEAPLVIGGAIAGGATPQIESLRAFGLPLGIAFQLRDDLLGVYGDPAVTGKPAGDDLREGKRTVLVAIARERLSTGQRRLLDELLGDPTLDAAQVRMLQDTIRACGAVDEVEAEIASNTDRALAALGSGDLDGEAVRDLTDLARAVTRRES